VGAIRAAEFSPQDSGRIISVGDDCRMKIWDVSHDELENETENFTENEGEYSVENGIHFPEEFFGHYGRINDVKISRDSGKIISAGDDGYVCLWDLNSQKSINAFEFIAENQLNNFKSCDFSLCENFMALAVNKKLFFGISARKMFMWCLRNILPKQIRVAFRLTEIK